MFSSTPYPTTKGSMNGLATPKSPDTMDHANDVPVMDETKMRICQNGGNVRIFIMDEYRSNG